MDEKKPIPIEENMSDDLKFVINYLNENNISPDDKIEVHYEEDDEDEDEDDDFGAIISEDDINDTDIEDDDDGEDDGIIEEEIDTSDLDNMF